MRIACTFPGKYGDLLWALPTIRALSRRIGEPIDLYVARDFASITSLISQQPYIGACTAIDLWETQDTAPISPRAPMIFDAIPTGYDAILDLGYRGWPVYPLPLETLHCLNGLLQETPKLGQAVIAPQELALEEPWITETGFTPLAPGGKVQVCAVGFTDEYLETKVGVFLLTMEAFRRDTLRETRGDPDVLFRGIGANARWTTEADQPPTTWEESVGYLQQASAFLGDCSALHVLAVAVGTPVVAVEPNPHRHHPIFWPCGQDGPQVTLVKGIDGLPTFDARHVYETLSRRMDAGKG